jgi:hypothetical protein
MGKIPGSYLPVRELWPQRIYPLPEHAAHPRVFNSTEQFIDRHVKGAGALSLSRP